MSLVLSGASLPTENTAEVGYTVMDDAGEVLVPRTNEGVVKVFSGVGYSVFQAVVDIEEPEFSDMTCLLWDDGAGNAVARFRGMVAGPPQGAYSRPSKLFHASGMPSQFQAGGV